MNEVKIIVYLDPDELTYEYTNNRLVSTTIHASINSEGKHVGGDFPPNQSLSEH